MPAQRGANQQDLGAMGWDAETAGVVQKMGYAMVNIYSLLLKMAIEIVDLPDLPS